MVFLTFQLLYQAPVLVTLTRIGNHCVVDATPEEESCSSASLLVATTPAGILATVKKVSRLMGPPHLLAYWPQSRRYR